MTLDEIAIKHGTDKATIHTRTCAKAHCYTPYYEWFFVPLRDKPIKLLEIGVGGGESIRTWLEYFTLAQIYGIDNNPDSWHDLNDRYTFVLGSQGDETFLTGFIEIHGKNWDIIIDDGSHFDQDIIVSHRHLWPVLNNGGLYIIEDLNVAYAGHPFTRPRVQNHMDFIKDKLDDINRHDEIQWMHFSKELCILKKK